MTLNYKGQKLQVHSWQDYMGVLTIITKQKKKLVLSGVERNRLMEQIRGGYH